MQAGGWPKRDNQTKGEHGAMNMESKHLKPGAAASVVAVNAISAVSTGLDYGENDKGEVEMEFDADPGLYQLSVIADASGFDWESLYVPLFSYGNSGQRTGPWDFHPTEGARALVPSYWADLDGRGLGLWYFQRMSVDDVRHKRFRGRLAFYVPTAGKHRLKLTRYRPTSIVWISALLEADPEDRIGEAPEAPGDWPDRCPAAAWRNPGFREELSAKLRHSHRMYAEPLQEAFAWVARSRSPQSLPLLIAKCALESDPADFEVVLDIVDEALASEHWGNPRPDGYGHDGDMGAMYTMWGLTYAYHALPERLGDERRTRMLDKLTIQGKRFFDKILLYRDYWGGSLLQDHGWRSMFGFGCTALHLLGLVPEASLWASYVLPRLDKSVAAMPTDGVIPASAHYSLHLYTDMVHQYRDALASLTGRDLYADDRFRRIVDYVAATLHEPDMVQIGWGRDRIHLVGGGGFLSAIASLHRDRLAAYIAKRLLGRKPDSFYAGPEEQAYYSSVLWGLLAHDETVEPVDRIERTASVSYWEDSGLVQYRDPGEHIVLSIKSGPSMGYNAYRRADGPCDRLGLGPDAGHFMVAVKGRPLLVSPDTGYRLSTEIRSCLLIGGKGQKDDIGYTMSVPSYRYAGEDIRSVEWDEGAGKGRIRLDLAAAYPEEAGVAAYTREFWVETGKTVRIRDHIVMDSPQKLEWLFQTKRENGLDINGLRCTLGSGTGAATLAAHATGLKLTVSVEEAPVVWSYVSHSHFKPFDTIRYGTVEAVRAAVVDFVLDWH